NAGSMNPGSMSFRRAILLAAAAFALAASAGATTFTVTVAPSGNLTFSPSSLAINVGDTVNWVWGSSGHSTTTGTPCNADGRWDSGVQNSPFSLSVTFSSAGTFPYFCVPHCFSGMTGQIIVQGPTDTPTPTPTATPTSSPAGTPTPTATPLATSIFALAPCRVADTRNAVGP